MNLKKMEWNWVTVGMMGTVEGQTAVVLVINLETKITEHFLCAAGGLVWKEEGHIKRLALVHRPKYNDWSLPKGKLKEGETWEQAAIREVQEETGVEAEIGEYAGHVCYLVDGVTKVVRFWNMAINRIDPIRKEGEEGEVDELRWLSVEAAYGLLSHDGERELLRQEMSRPPITRGRSFLNWLFTDSLSHHRLQNALKETTIEMDRLIACCEAKKIEVMSWVVPMRRYLLMVDQALKDNDSNSGWQYMQAADLMWLRGLSSCNQEEFNGRAVSIIKEAEQKLKDWRKTTVEHLTKRATPKIGGDMKDKGEGPPVQYELAPIIEIRKVLDDHFRNLYNKQWISRRRLLTLAILALIPMGLWVYIAPSILDTSYELLISVVSFGVLGAVVSGLISIAGATSSKRIPELLASWSTSLARLVVGAGAALALYVFLLSGMLNLGELTTGLILGVSFVSGFSERFVVRAVERVEI